MQRWFGFLFVVGLTIGCDDLATTTPDFEPELAPPQLVGPVDGEAISAEYVRFDWSAVNGAEAYHVVINDELYYSVLTNSLDLNVDRLPERDEYRWKVKAISSVYLGELSEEWVFTAYQPEETVIYPHAPLPGATICSLQTDLTWTVTATPVAFQIEIAPDPSVAATATATALATNSSHTATFTAGDWYWRVGFEDNESVVKWADWRLIHVTPLEVPSALLPADLALVCDAFTPFSWTDATNTLWDIEIATDSAFSQGLRYALGLTTPDYDDEILSVGTYYWRVRGSTADSCAGDWSVTQQIDVTTSPC